jgi:hypothetical protein
MEVEIINSEFERCLDTSQEEPILNQSLKWMRKSLRNIIDLKLDRLVVLHDVF